MASAASLSAVCTTYLKEVATACKDQKILLGGMELSSNDQETGVLAEIVLIFF